MRSPWQGCRLVERADLALEQRQVVQRVKHKVFPLVGPDVPGDDVGAARDHHRVDIAADQHLAMAVGVATRNDVRPDAQSRAFPDARWLRLAGVSDAGYWRMGAQSVRRTRDHAGRRTVGETDGTTVPQILFAI